MKQIPAFHKQPHHVFVQTFARLHSRDRTAEWWTVTNEALFYQLRGAIPFDCLYCHEGPGGLVIYLDRPKVPACPNCGHEVAA